jgi:hypothetical protein
MSRKSLLSRYDYANRSAGAVILGQRAVNILIVAVEDRAMHELLQDHGAMMDWIAVPNVLNGYR